MLHSDLIIIVVIIIIMIIINDFIFFSVSQNHPELGLGIFILKDGST